MKFAAFMIISFLTYALNAQVIKNKKYVSDIRHNSSHYIVFKNDTQGVFTCTGGGCDCDIEFKYKIFDENKLEMSISQPKDQGYDMCPDVFARTFVDCENILDTAEPIYQDQIICGSEKFMNIASTKPGTEISIDNTPAIYMGDVKAKVTTPVKIREEPDVESAQGVCTHNGDDDSLKPISVFPKNVELYIVARTPEKETVGKWKNYWYFVKTTPAFDYECSFPENVTKPYLGSWIFGEFVKIDK